ncbi:LbetaH domain-containing protein [Candidatus Methanoperedens nitratireducens]|uniref:Carbonic anhydrase n=1 Tax=Candidatus Methanoperedens nitratireducens TaxID=1392998 RepID=A0A284VSJ6_9EURY|nr:carbonic anhydrase [Candidatus Methanoperedens nitroreducens]SNQ62178.1 Carbonic anhydrase [Candidatus Methanoperedens nitroreducens]
MVIIKPNHIKISILIVLAVLLATGCVERVEQVYSKSSVGASPMTPWNNKNIKPDIELSAYVHPQASVIGAVYIGKNVMVSPQASVRGDEGMPIHIGNDTNVQDGVSIHALETSDEEGKPVEKNLVEVKGQKYAVYIGDRVSLAHQAQVHGPASVGDDTFVGMQAFVFKSKVGNNVVIEPAARVVGVTIPDGRYVPLGMIVSNQSVADALPVITEDYVFAHLNEGVLHVNTNLAKGYNMMGGKSAPEASEGDGGHAELKKE